MNYLNKVISILALVSITYGLTIGNLLGQGSSAGTITGIVMDVSGAVMPGVMVSVQNVNTNLTRSMKTDNAGVYFFTSLPVGVYELQARAPGFKNIIVSRVRLDVNATLREDFHMQVGEVSQNVTVNAETPLLNTANASLGAIVERKEVEDLPLNGRDFTQLELLSPGMVSTNNLQTSTGLTGGATAYNIQIDASMPESNGARGGSTLYTVDGAEDINQGGRTILFRPAVDDIQEFKAETANMSAKFGYGDNVVNVALKSGTNQLHGAVYDFLRNNALDARSFFATSTPTLIQNQFGGNLGGPLVIPHVYHGKNRTFWFGSYEGLRRLNGQIFQATVPTAVMRLGDFSQWPFPIYDPATTRLNPNQPGTYLRDPFPRNQIPSNRINSVANYFLVPSWIPLPNKPGVTNNLFQQLNVPTSSDQGTLKVDHQLSSRTYLSARSSWEETNEGSFGPYHGLTTYDPGANPRSAMAGQSTVSLTHTFNPTNVLTLRATYDRGSVFYNTPNHLGVDLTTQVGIQGFSRFNSVDKTYPSFTIASMSGLPRGFILGYATNQYAYTANYAMVHGPHTFEFGTSWRQWMQGSHAANTAGGSFDFSGTYTDNPSAPGGTGAGLADFMLGLPDSGGDFVTHNYYYQMIKNSWSYFNDDWKVTHKLTLNLGVRYEINWPAREKYDHWSTFCPKCLGGQGAIVVPTAQSIAQPNSIAVTAITVPAYQNLIITAAQAGLNSKYMQNVGYANFAPRFGIAYRITPQTVIRGGYGIYYLNLDGNRVTELESTPFTIRENGVPNTPYIPTFTTQTLFGGGGTVSQYPPVTGHDPYVNQFGYVQQWNFTLERNLSANTLLQIGYVGNRGNDLDSHVDINTPNPGPGAFQPRRPFPNYQSIPWYTYGGWSDYSSLQASVEHRFSHGLSLLGAFTWSKAMDLASDPTESLDPFNAEVFSRGLSDFNVPFNFTLSSTYNLPLPSGLRGLKATRAILGGWELAPIITLQSGYPFSLTAAGDPTNSGLGTRPNVVPGCNPHLSNSGPNLWFNPACYSTPPGPPNTLRGNVARNSLMADATHNLDLGLYKNIPLRGEQRSLQIRFESYNLFNVPTFGVPDAFLNDPAVGKIFSSSAGRIIQIAAKLSF